ncbi:MAG: 2-oxoacid:acceptor oxidoreductase subunit alpha [Tissierella sp.]|uniref:2-oxoacid:acceptor oxidoreductase subunit alpha n=1 Tax=Tissierella sp. TaxID=41274 RepID=UPI003F946C91
MYNILIGGAAGDGIETTAVVLEKTLKSIGYNVFSMRDFMSRVRGGHNFNKIRFGNKPVYTHKRELDGLIAINEESFNLHKDDLKKDGFIICDPSLSIEHPNLIKLDFKSLAKEAGNVRAGGSVIIGTILSLYGLDLGKAQETFKDFFPTKILDANLKALSAGYDQVKKSYEIGKEKDLSNHVMINGAEAMSSGALAGNMRFYSAYPMSPATTLLNYFNNVKEDANIVVEQAEDEIAAMNQALGAAAAGARAMTGSSGGGFSLMVEALGMAGVAEIPLVVANVQRPGPATGLPTRTEQSDLRFMIHASQGEFPRMVISPQNHKETYHQSQRAFDIAQKYQIPVLLLSDQFLADSSSVIHMDEMLDHKDYLVKELEQDVEIEVDENGVYKRYQYTDTGISPLKHYGDKDYLVKMGSEEHTEYGVLTESGDVRNKMVNKRAKKFELLKEELIEPLFVGDENPEILIVGFGSTYESIKEAVELLNDKSDTKYAFLSFGDVHPLPTKKLLKYSKIAKRVVSIEQNFDAQFAGIVRQETLIDCKPAFLKYDGRQMHSEEIIEALEILDKEVK